MTETKDVELLLDDFPEGFFKRFLWCYQNFASSPPLKLLFKGSGPEIISWYKTHAQAMKVAHLRGVDGKERNVRTQAYFLVIFGTTLLITAMLVGVIRKDDMELKFDANPNVSSAMEVTVQEKTGVVQTSVPSPVPSEEQLSSEMPMASVTVPEDPKLMVKVATPPPPSMPVASPVASAVQPTATDQSVASIPDNAEVVRLINWLKTNRQSFERVGVHLYNKRTKRGVDFQTAVLKPATAKFLCDRGVNLLEQRYEKQQRLALAARELEEYCEATEKSLTSLRAWQKSHCH